jgi:hypothetical protein
MFFFGKGGQSYEIWVQDNNFIHIKWRHLSTNTQTEIIGTKITFTYNWKCAPGGEEESAADSDTAKLCMSVTVKPESGYDVPVKPEPGHDVPVKPEPGHSVQYYDDDGLRYYTWTVLRTVPEFWGCNEDQVKKLLNFFQEYTHESQWQSCGAATTSVFQVPVQAGSSANQYLINL